MQKMCLWISLLSRSVQTAVHPNWLLSVNISECTLDISHLHHICGSIFEPNPQEADFSLCFCWFCFFRTAELMVVDEGSSSGC